MKKKTKSKKIIVVRTFDLEHPEIGQGEYVEFVSIAAAKRWLKEPTQVGWIHNYEIAYTIYKVVPV